MKKLILYVGLFNCISVFAMHNKSSLAYRIYYPASKKRGLKKTKPHELESPKTSALKNVHTLYSEHTTSATAPDEVFSLQFDGTLSKDRKSFRDLYQFEGTISKIGSTSIAKSTGKFILSYYKTGTPFGIGLLIYENGKRIDLSSETVLSFIQEINKQTDL